MGHLLRTISRYFFVKRDDWLKVGLLTLCFLLVIGSYSIVKELKDSIFVSLVGREYIPTAKLLTLFLLVPAILFYARLVDRVRRYQLLYIYSIFYALLGLMTMYVIGHPSWGISNTDTGPYRIFGWIFYFLIESFSPFLVSVFWAFANSINNPEEAKRNYAFMVAGSKIGGMLTTGFAWWFFSMNGTGCRLYGDVTNHQIILFVFSLLVALIPVVLYVLVHKVPGYQMHGYEAVYQLEKQKQKEAKKLDAERDVGTNISMSVWRSLDSVFSGLLMLVRKPYVLGIFGMLFFYEVVQTVLSFARLGIAQSTSTDITGLSCFLFKVAFIQHFVGFIISGIGTQRLLVAFGEQICLMLIPISTAVLLCLFMIYHTPNMLLFTLIALRAINYAFSQPVRESLYIPTVKDVKFKSKSWIDSFGSKLAKGFGSGFNTLEHMLGAQSFLTLQPVFFGFVTLIWFVVAYLLGKRYARAIKHDEVIA